MSTYKTIYDYNMIGLNHQKHIQIASMIVLSKVYQINAYIIRYIRVTIWNVGDDPEFI